jgi:ELWxxDGT repeat protein
VIDHQERIAAQGLRTEEPGERGCKRRASLRQARGWARCTGFALALASGSASALLAHAAEPVVIRDIKPGPASSDPDGFTRLGQRYFFRADDGVHGFELWETDGTSSGTSLAIDLRAGDPGGLPGGITSVAGELYFTAFDTPVAEGSKVFVSDGTASGTRFLVDTYPGLRPGPFDLPGGFTPFGKLVLFTAIDPEGGYELWRSDGTPSGTARVIDLHPGPQWSIPSELTPWNGVVYFSADDSVVVNPDGSATFDRELFRTDGTAAGTFRVKDINPGPEPSWPLEFKPFRESLYFTAFEPSSGTELWKTDGTANGTLRVADIHPGPGNALPSRLTLFGEQLVFTADDGESGAELWLSDGTSAGTRRVKDIRPGADSSHPSGFIAVGPQVFFSADDGLHGSELWRSDGTASGTRLVRDIVSGSALSGPLWLTAVGGTIYFVTVQSTERGDDTVYTEIWKSDGSTSGTSRVWRAPGRSFGYSIRPLRVLGSQLLFTAPSAVDAQGFSTDVELQGLPLDTLTARGS